jgi:hypothetical protein
MGARRREWLSCSTYVEFVVVPMCDSFLMRESCFMLDVEKQRRTSDVIVKRGAGGERDGKEGRD